MERIGTDVYKQSNVGWVITHVMDPISIPPRLPMLWFSYKYSIIHVHVVSCWLNLSPPPCHPPLTVTQRGGKSCVWAHITSHRIYNTFNTSRYRPVQEFYTHFTLLSHPLRHVNLINAPHIRFAAHRSQNSQNNLVLINFMSKPKGP